MLVELSRIAAPFVPFVSEAIYRNLRTGDMPASVHLCDFPVPDGSQRDAELEAFGLGRICRQQHSKIVRSQRLL